MKKFLLTLLLTLSSAVAFAFSGSGTEADPYLIKTADDLYLIRNSPSAYYRLTNDIDLTQWIADNYPDTGWTPICGSSSNCFTGTLDGSGFTISNLFINRTTNYNGLIGFAGRGAIVKNLNIDCDITGGQNYTGAIVGYGIETILINCSATGKVRGIQRTGGLVGDCSFLNATDCLFLGVLEGKYMTGGIVGSTTGPKLTRCAVEANIKAEDSYTGGLVGYMDRGSAKAGASYVAFINQCYVKGNVFSTSSYVGGIIGYDESNIISSWYENGGYVYAFPLSQVKDVSYEGNVSANGDYVGGICGYARGEYSKCITKGTVWGRDYVGGVAGLLSGSTMNSYYNYSKILSCVILNSRIDAQGSHLGRVCNISTPCTLGKLGSVNENKVISSCELYRNMDIENALEGDQNGYVISSAALKRAITYEYIEWDFTNTWDIDEGEGYPYLRFRQPSGGSVSKEEKAAFDFTKPAQLSPSVTPAGEEDAGVNVTTKTFRSNDVTISFGLGSRTQSFSARVWTNDDMSNSLRVYKDGTMTISTSANNVITRISFSGEDTSSMTASEGNISGGTWTGEAQSVTFTIGASYNKINTIDVAYKHDILALTDVAPAILAGTFEPGKVKYGRVTTGNYASFCLPFDVDLSAAEGIEKVYMPMEQILYNTQTQYLMMFLKEQDMTSTVKAGTPFLAKVADSEVCFSNVKRVSYSEPLTSNPTEKPFTVFDFDGKSGVLYQNNTLDVTWGGTYVATTATTGLNSFNINGSFGQHSGTLSPYRAYVMQTTKSGANSNVRGIQLNLGDDEGEVTSIFQLLNAPAATESIFDMQGRRVLNPQQGGLYIINGKKVRL